MAIKKINSDMVFVIAAQLPDLKKVPIAVSKYHWTKYATRYYLTRKECQERCNRINELEVWKSCMGIEQFEGKLSE